MFDLDRDRISRALKLFGHRTFLGKPLDAFRTVFECLGADLTNRAAGLGKPERPLPNPAAAKQLSRLFQYASFRFTELLIRLDQLNWMQAQFESKRGEEAESWYNFAALAIKDFHIDLSSLMDAVAATMLQTVQAFDAEEKAYLPGFADIQKPAHGKPGQYYNKIPEEVRELVDQTEQWWPDVKNIRNLLTHREHRKIVFGDATDGVLFQVYTPGHEAIILDTHLLWQEGDHVVDFRLYSAAVLAEFLVFLDDLGTVLATHLKLPGEDLAPLTRVGDFTYLLEPLRRLLAILEQPSK